jgi:hypothetical protein
MDCRDKETDVVQGVKVSNGKGVSNKNTYPPNPVLLRNSKDKFTGEPAGSNWANASEALPKVTIN